MAQKQRFILVSIVPPNTPKKHAIEDLEELKNLVATYGGADVIDIIQRRAHPDGKTYIGSGKALSIASLVGRKRIDGIVINALVIPYNFTISKNYAGTVILISKSGTGLILFSIYLQTMQLPLSPSSKLHLPGCVIWDLVSMDWVHHSPNKQEESVRGAWEKLM